MHHEVREVERRCLQSKRVGSDFNSPARATLGCGYDLVFLHIDETIPVCATSIVVMAKVAAKGGRSEGDLDQE